MFCNNCGKEIPAGAAFCAACGKPVARPAQSAPAAQTRVQPSASTAPKGKKSVFLVVMSVILLLSAVGSLISVFTNGWYSFMCFEKGHDEAIIVACMFILIILLTIAKTVFEIMAGIKGITQKNPAGCKVFGTLILIFGLIIAVLGTVATAFMYEERCVPYMDYDERYVAMVTTIITSIVFTIPYAIIIPLLYKSAVKKLIAARA